MDKLSSVSKGQMILTIPGLLVMSTQNFSLQQDWAIINILKESRNSLRDKGCKFKVFLTDVLPPTWGSYVKRYERDNMFINGYIIIFKHCGFE